MRPAGSIAAASEPGRTSHGARNARATRLGDAIAPTRDSARLATAGRTEASPRHHRRSLRREGGAARPAGEVGGGQTGAQQGRHERAGRRPDQEIGTTGVPAELVAERTEDAGVKRVTDGAPGAEDDGDRAAGYFHRVIVPTVRDFLLSEEVRR